MCYMYNLLPSHQDFSWQHHRQQETSLPLHVHIQCQQYTPTITGITQATICKKKNFKIIITQQINGREETIALEKINARIKQDITDSFYEKKKKNHLKPTNWIFFFFFWETSYKQTKTKIQAMANWGQQGSTESHVAREKTISKFINFWNHMLDMDKF